MTILRNGGHSQVQYTTSGCLPTNGELTSFRLIERYHRPQLKEVCDTRVSPDASLRDGGCCKDQSTTAVSPPKIASCLILTTLPYIMSALSGLFTPDAEKVTVLATLIRMIKLIWSKNNEYNNNQQYW